MRIAELAANFDIHRPARFTPSLKSQLWPPLPGADMPDSAEGLILPGGIGFFGEPGEHEIVATVKTG